ncbi:MAG TPA: hypothetical protein VL985_01510 [Stellaceae bacterium]|nr:hypothetical protein [Stellaceae bacterium]
MKTDLYIGPLIERSGKFAYDTFSQVEGMRSSFRYPRIEQARHDRRAMIAELRLDPRFRVHVCETLAEFEQQRAEAQKRGDATPVAGRQS